MMLPFADTEIVSFYNVENFFTPDPPPQHKRNPTPSGLYNWDEKKYQNKLLKIAGVFHMMEEREGVLPMLIGFSEIQGRKPLEDLAALSPFNEKYGIVHYNSLDERGVDVGLLYDKEKIEIISSEPLSYFFTVQKEDYEYFDTTRDVLFCKVKYQNILLNVFVLHLPSKREKDVNKSRREYILEDLKLKIEEISKTSGEPVLILGDFNENPDEKMIADFLYDKDYNKLLINPFLQLYQNEKFSTFHYKSGLLFDQMMLTRHFLENNFPLRLKEAKVFNHEKLHNWHQRFSGRPFRTYSGSRYLGGYSDHFPILITFTATT